jgi:hypothetical protein
LLLDEGDIIDDESARLADGGEILDHAFRADQPIAAAVESPGATERAVPWTPAREFNRGAGIEHADEIFAALAHEIARRPDLVEVLDEARPGALALGGDGAGHFGDCVTVARDGFKQPDDAGLALALEHAIDGAFAMFQNGLRGEGSAVAADADEGAWQSKLRSFRQIDDLGHIGEVVAGKGDEIRLPLREHAVIVGVALTVQAAGTHWCRAMDQDGRKEFSSAEPSPPASFAILG